MRATTKGQGHLKMTEATGTTTKGEDPATMITMGPIAKYHQDIKTTPTKETTAETQGITTMAEKIQVATSSSNQEDQMSIIKLQMTC
jgi:hypothetical protein